MAHFLSGMLTPLKYIIPDINKDGASGIFICLRIHYGGAFDSVGRQRLGIGIESVSIANLETVSTQFNGSFLYTFPYSSQTSLHSLQHN